MDKVIRESIVRVGVDLAKRVIQVHAVDATGRVVTARALAREKFLPWCAQLPPHCVVAMETCSGAHHWARRLRSMGLASTLIAGHFVGPYRMEGRRGKNDANDAAAVCEAAGRPHMRFGTYARIAAVALHDASEAGPWHELHDLGKQGLADVHAYSPGLSDPGKYAVPQDQSSSRHQTKSACRPRQCLISTLERSI